MVAATKSNSFNGDDLPLNTSGDFGRSRLPLSLDPIRSDQEQIRRTLELLCRPTWDCGGVVEVRALGTTKGTVSGYFDADHIDELVNLAVRYSGEAQGVYLTLNPAQRDCLARAANRGVLFAKHTTADREVTHRHWLLIDADPSRPSGISSNDAEHEAALERVRAVRAHLRERGWPEPIYADSGNGGHLLYRIDLSTDDGGLLKRTLKALDQRFSDPAVGIDLKVYNPGRISKLYGTSACKGDSLPDRPHRIARLIDVPDQIEVVSREKLESFANDVKPTVIPSQISTATNPTNGKSFDVVGYLRSHGVEVGKRKELPNGATLWELEKCPWRPDQGDGGAFVIQFPDGKVTAGCHHDHCDGKGWDDLRDVIDPNWRTDAKSKKSSGRGPTLTQQILALAAEDELFHTDAKVAYATISKSGRKETWRVDGESYRLNLRGRLHEHGIVPPRGALDDAIATLESKAIFSGPCRPVFVRTAGIDNRMYIDLCNEAWEVVEIDSEGWKVVGSSPVRFVRHPGMLPLPRPIAGGNVLQLRKYINVGDAGWPFVAGWILGGLRHRGPYPILGITGERGSCKSTATRRIRSMVDPNAVPLRNAPKNEQTLMIWATNSHVIALDNLSLIKTDLSNAMCRLATGGGHSERRHYSDDAESLFNAVRPQMFNGIEEVATRSDLLDRTLTIHLPVMPQENRKTDEELDEQFAQDYPAIFGAFLSAASHGLRRLPEIKAQNLSLPRLADYAQWITACEEGLGWEPGTFLNAMRRSEQISNDVVLADSPVARAVCQLLKLEDEFDGGAEQLLDRLRAKCNSTLFEQEGWPKNAQSLSGKLRDCAPNLRGSGIAVKFYDDERPKRIRLQRQPATVIGNVDGQSVEPIAQAI